MTSNMSLPSRAVSVIDVPEVQNVTATFVYNFFVANERIVPVSSKFNVSNVDRAPRYVKVSWSPVHIHVDDSQDKTVLSNSTTKQAIDFSSMLSKNAEKIQDETSVSSSGFTSIILESSNVMSDLSDDSKLLLESSVAGASSSSGAEKAKILNSVTSDAVSLQNLLAVMSANDANGFEIINDGKIASQKSHPIFSGVESTRFYFQVASKRISTVLRALRSSAFSPHSRDSDDLGKLSSNIQKSAETKFSLAEISEDDYFPTVVPIDLKTSEEKVTSSSTVVGYLVKRTAILSNGTISNKDVVLSGSATTFFDFDVLYGASYSYEIRAVAVVALNAVSSGLTKKFNSIKTLISSRPSRSTSVVCEEFDPPPPPTDFRVVWNYEKRLPTLMWSLPSNHSRDIKRFQVFKRDSILDPYSLLIEYDFDDTVYPLGFGRANTSGEIPSNVVKCSGNPIMFYEDHEFSAKKSAVYALCTIDAHGMTSSYSQQLFVRYDLGQNRAVVKRASQSGAPKQFPNFYLTSELEDIFGTPTLTSDAMRVSGVKKMNVSFAPEYLNVTDRNGVSMKLLSTDKTGGKYVFNVINIDRQSASSLTLTVNDVATALSK